jgi:hypothetical protein
VAGYLPNIPEAVVYFHSQPGTLISASRKR